MNIKSILFFAKSDSSVARTDDETEEDDTFGEEDYSLEDDLGIGSSPMMSADVDSVSLVDGVSTRNPAPNGSVSTPSSHGIGGATASPAGMVSQGGAMATEATDVQVNAPGEKPSEDAGEDAAHQSDDPEMDGILDIFTEDEEVDENLSGLCQDLEELDMNDLLAECYELAGALQERAGY